MPGSRKPRRIRPRDPDVFEEHVTATLEAQDRMLERLEEKLERPALNGGFDNLVSKVEKINSITESLNDQQADILKKIDSIHTAIYEPDTGLYQKVKETMAWTQTATLGLKWMSGLLIAGLLTGLGKMLYAFIVGHIHFNP